MAQRRLVKVQDRKNTNLQIDVTPNFGEKYCSYISDEDDKCYLLGMRRMADKSAQATLYT